MVQYNYEVSMPAAATFIALFALTTLLHTFQLIRSRTWFMILFVVGGLCEVIGYIGRVLSATENPGPYSRGYYILQFVALLVAPSFLAASLYMILGRIVLMLRAAKLLPWIRRTWLTKLFVVGDTISFLLQAAGGGIMASGEGSEDTGKDIVVLGLFVQIGFFGLFVLVASIFHWRLSRGSTEASRMYPWRRHMYALYVVSILIFVRSIVRIVEFIQGLDGYIISHEVYLYVFDALLMWIAMVVVNWVHPSEIGQIIAERKSKERTQDRIRSHHEEMEMGDAEGGRMV